MSVISRNVGAAVAARSAKSSRVSPKARARPTSASSAVSVGLASARNTIDTNVSAFTSGLTTLSATHGDITLTATEQAIIDATATAVAIGLNAAAGNSAGVSGGGSGEVGVGFVETPDGGS